MTCKRATVSVVRMLLLLAAGAATALSQPSAVLPEVEDISVEIFGEMPLQEIVNRMGTKESPWGIWVFLNENIYEKIGAPREYFDRNIFRQDIINISDYLRDNGFFSATIDTALTFDPSGKSLEINITIHERQRSLIDTVVIAGVEHVSPEALQEIRQKTLLKTGDPYVKKNVIEEQARIIRVLGTAGYPDAFLDTVGLARYASTNNISVFLKFTTGNRYVFGNAHFETMDPRIDSVVMLRQLDFEQGQLYNEDKRIASEQNLNRLGVFEFASLRKSAVESGQNEHVIPLMISFRMLELQEITPEFLVLNENNSLFSTGLGLSYKHRNLFGGAQNFSISTRARANEIEKLNYGGAFRKGLAEPTLFGKADIESQLVFPYFFSNKTSASITLTAEAEKQRDYDLNTLRGKVGFTTKLATYTTGITELNIERVDPVYKAEKATGIRADDSTKQFNIIESFTLQRDVTNNFFSPTSGFFHSLTVEEAGLINRTAGGFGLPYSEYFKLSFLLKHYFSGETNQSFVFAVKLKAGFAQLYNESVNPTPVPLPRRFFAGGSNSVRGWKDKQLADFSDVLQGGNVGVEGSVETRIQLFPNGGTINILELPRFWSVFFVDAGNTWRSFPDVRANEVAVAVGAGLRYETFVGPFRFDAAWRLYDPKQPPGSQWLTEQRFFHNSFSLVHFGIGHAF